jgi:tryptophanyl-tRNA synthetase
MIEKQNPHTQSSGSMNDLRLHKASVVLTGDRPTGKLHLGHYVGSLVSRLELQKEHSQIILIADTQALTDNANNPAKVSANISEVLLDYLAVGIDPRTNTIFLQSHVPELFEISAYLSNLVTLARLERNPTVKEEIKQKGFERRIPVGFLTYPISQAADIVAFRTTHVPVGDDQLPMLELCNEIVDSFNRTYNTDVLQRCAPILSECSRLPGLDGKAKMSKSLGNAIYLADTNEEIARKVSRMYTDPKHVRVEDPGHLEGNVVFEYLEHFDKDHVGLRDLKENYTRGGIADSLVKRRLANALIDLIEPIRRRREELQRDPAYLEQVLQEGTERARTVAANTLREVRDAIGINRF